MRDFAYEASVVLRFMECLRFEMERAACAARCPIFPCDQEDATDRASGRTSLPCDSMSREVAVRRIGFIFQSFSTQSGAYFESPSLSALLAGQRT